MQHSKCATTNLTIYLRERGIDISLIYEPWVKNNIYYKQNEGKLRACIIIKKDINAFIFSNYGTADNAVVKVEQEGGNRIIKHVP